jgi:hypothetical protein
MSKAQDIYVCALLSLGYLHQLNGRGDDERAGGGDDEWVLSPLGGE